jgi:putative colanic acid biosynthesis acetyltransferase WcaF
MNFKNRQIFLSRVRRNIWRAVSYLPFNFLPHYSGNCLRRILLVIFGAKCGKGVTVNNKVIIYDPQNLVLNDNVSIGPGVNLYCVDKIIIGSHTVISQRAQLLTASHDYTTSDFPLVTKPIIIGEYCWISQGVYVLPGVTLSDNIVCAAASVINKSFNESCVVLGGNPCKILKQFKFVKVN